jgi:SAM-dependent methyltransferase
MTPMSANKSFRARAMTERWANGQVATNEYRTRLTELVRPGMKILHAGCGWDRNEISRQFKKDCTVVGVDIDSRVGPLFHSEFHLGSLDALPFGDSIFDVIFSEYVFEHLTNPQGVLRELKRVLKPDGTILILTPNYYSYKTIAASVTPQKFHVAMGRHRYGSGHEADMYPTMYRCNTKALFERLASRAGLRIKSLDFVTNGPTWFQKIPGLFEVFHVFHLTIKRWESLKQLRCALIVEMTNM